MKKNINIYFNNKYEKESNYIIDVIFRDFLGLDYKIHWDKNLRDIVKITSDGYDGILEMPQKLFSTKKVDWLKSTSMPIQPLYNWESYNLKSNINISDHNIPIIYGESSFFKKSEKHIKLPIDILGSAFFMLSRYEEIVIEERDKYDRFSAFSSLAYKENFLYRPIIDEYVEILWDTLSLLFPNIERKPKPKSIFPTCDVDFPYKTRFNPNFNKITRKIAKHIIKDKSALKTIELVKSEYENIKNIYKFKKVGLDNDEYVLNLKWMMDIAENHERKILFYFLTDKTNINFDSNYKLEERIVTNIIKEIHHRKHNIGLHPSYETYRNLNQTKIEYKKLVNFLYRNNINQTSLCSRQHFLRWNTPETAEILNEVGIISDSSLGYADLPGFRCGTSREFKMFNAIKSKELSITQRPLIIMDVSFISDNYLGAKNFKNTLDLMLTLKNRALQIGGEFTFLWHNSRLSSKEYRKYFLSLIR